MNQIQADQRDRLAQWAFDTRPILGRFHLWLDEVESEWTRGRPTLEAPREMSFVNGQIERLLAMTAAVTALGTRLFGRHGEGAGATRAALNQVKKDADAISAYAMSEGLWYLTRQLPENHAIMVCLGEGLMPKVGETPEMGSNPQLGFGRVYARPEVARWLDHRVVRLLNDPGYGWEEFYGEIKRSGITVWGAAIDTLENTSRFAKGSPTGPMTILHLFDQPLHVLRPYEGYMGTMVLPREVVEAAARRSILLDYRTPRARVVEAIEEVCPGIRREHIHVWTLGGKSREGRIGGLWAEWGGLGVHLVEEGWTLPSGLGAFTESGTYAPTFRVGFWEDEAGAPHLLLCDGYAASAEAVQAATLAEVLGLEASLSVFTSSFTLPVHQERHLMRLDPDAPGFPERLGEILGRPLEEGEPARVGAMIREAAEAGIPLDRATLRAEDFFPEKRWDVLAVSGFMSPDPYTGAPGVEDLGDGRWRVTVRLTSGRADKRVRFTLRSLKPGDQVRPVFLPLLNRFLAGEDYRDRPVKISDSGRIRNELQTLCVEALEFPGEDRIRLHLDRIPQAVIPLEAQARLREVLTWYKVRHPLWFAWLELAGD